MPNKNEIFAFPCEPLRGYSVQTLFERGKKLICNHQVVGSSPTLGLLFGVAGNGGSVFVLPTLQMIGNLTAQPDDEGGDTGPDQVRDEVPAGVLIAADVGVGNGQHGNEFDNLI